jgi:hypothetical protein
MVGAMKRFDVYASSGATRYMIGRYAANDRQQAIDAARAKIAEVEPGLLAWSFSAVEVY